MLSGSFNLDVQELCRPCNKCTITVRWFTSIKDIKDLLKVKFNAPPSRMSVFCISNPKSLRNQTTLHELGIDQSGHTLRVAINMTSNTSFQLLLSKDIRVDDSCKDMMSCVRQGFERSQVPSKTDLFDCTGGVYFLKASSGEKVAVFKPNDEEQGMPNNPKGHAGNGEEGLRPFFRPGQGYIRETAAYLMDFKNFCQVPPTTIVHCEHSCFHYPSMQNGLKQSMYPKVGSLQSFVHAGDTFEDISPSLIGILELQKIAILDIRLLNCDRNSSNILAIRKAAPNTFHNGTRCRRDSRSSSMGSYTTDEYGMMSCDDVEFNPFQEEEGPNTSSGGADMFELIPIDHGYCIPSRLKIDELDWIWFYCPQIAKEVDPEIRRYVASLDVEQLVGDLEDQLKIDEYSCFLLRLAHRVLVTGIAAGLTLFDIAQIVARTDEDRPSPLEKVIKTAEENAHRTLEMRSNRLNSRGGGDSSGHNLSSMNTKSPVRFHEDSVLTGKSPHQNEKTPVHRPMGLSRVVQSAHNLMGLDKDVDSSASLRLLKPAKSLTKVHSYLSSENIEKLKLSSPHAPPKFPLSFAMHSDVSVPFSGSADRTLLNDSPVGDFYLAELSPLRRLNQNLLSVEKMDKSEVFPSVSLGLNRSLVQSGDKLKTMQSVDSSSNFSQAFRPFSSLSDRESALTTAFSAASSSSSSGKASGSYLRTGVLRACDEDLHYQKSEPIMMALRDSSSSGYSDVTTSSETSKEEGEDGFSPKSFGDTGFFSTDHLTTNITRSTQLFVTPFDDVSLADAGAASLLSLRGSAAERPFPPRSEKSEIDKRESFRGDMIDLSRESSTSDEDTDTKSDQVGAKEQLQRDASMASFSSFRSTGALTNLHRVASFNAFESPAIYEEIAAGYGKTCDRQLTILHREQRKAVALTTDFQDLRLKFAYEAISVLTSKELRLKKNSKRG
jgi:hypothetical protein